MEASIVHVNHNGNLLAIVIRNEFSKDGVSFFTENEHSQQLAFMKYESGKKIEAHFHNAIYREVFYTQEVLVIKKGKLRVDFYDSDRSYFKSYILCSGDTILLISGGHGFEVLESLEMIEVKQGPYAGDGDKTRFKSVDSREIKLTSEVCG